jgi:hypothetical protein
MDFVIGTGSELCQKFAGQKWASVEDAAANGADGLRDAGIRSAVGGALAPVAKLEDGEFCLRRCTSIAFGVIATVYEQRF